MSTKPPSIHKSVTDLDLISKYFELLLVFEPIKVSNSTSNGNLTVEKSWKCALQPRREAMVPARLAHWVRALPVGQSYDLVKPTKLLASSLETLRW